MLFLLIVNIFGQKIFTYNDTSKAHTIRLTAGQYTIECFGGQGGSGYHNAKPSIPGGKGAYARGVLDIETEIETFYAYIGGEGKSSKAGPNAGGANYGGSGGNDYSYNPFDQKGDDAPGGGGGATDLRYNSKTLSSRIIVAAGGSGGAVDCPGAPGGCLYGYIPERNNIYKIDDRVGQTGTDRPQGESGDQSPHYPGSGAGGGWRGGYKAGTASDPELSYTAVASSGSSYISGYNGCINRSKKFTGGVMKAGVNEGSGKLVITVNFNCSENCISCTSANVCKKCKNGFLLHDNKCVSSCPQGYTSISSSCKECASPCKTCTTDLVTCSSCVSGYFLNGTKCLKDCPDGFYANTKTSKCEMCNEACELCDSSPTNCFKCASNYSLYNNECIEMCPDGMTNVENTCQHCIPSCKTCSSSPSECTSCQPGLYLHMNQCLEECPNNFFADKENGVCSKCESPCETCDAKNKCITCLEGFNLSSGECVEA